MFKPTTAMNSFNPDMLSLARDLRGLSQVELAERMGIKQGTLSKIEHGLLEVGDHLPKLSEVLGLPVGFFLQTGRQFRANAHFYRKKTRIPKKELYRAEATMNLHKLNLEKLLKDVDIPPVNLPRWDVEEKGSPRLYAKYLREYWRLPKGRIEHLTDLVENNGVIVVHTDFEDAEMDGLSLCTIDSQPLIFLSKKLSGDRLRLTLAHELGHLGMHFAQQVAEDRDVEQEAFEFASELLMPEDEILPQLAKLNLPKLAQLKKYWRVSMGAVLVCAKKLGAVSDSVYRSLWMQMGKLGYRTREPQELDVPFEKPTIVEEILDTYLDELEYSKPELAQMLCISEEDLETLYFAPKVRLKVVRN